MFNPYEALGLAETATLEEIKKSYRSLAKRWHPDLNAGNKEAEHKFKDVSHAFDLIGTAEAKAKWDRGETEEQQRHQYEEHARRQRAGHGRPGAHPGGGYSFSFGDEGPGQDFFEELFRSARGRQAPAERDVTYQMEVEFREAALGAEKQVGLPDGRTIQVRIPAGVEAGKKLRFKGLAPGGGDVYVELSVKPLEGYVRRGLDVESEVPVSFIDAVAGGEVKVTTLDGEVELKVPAGVSTGSRLRIKGKGAGPAGARGNHIVRLKVVVPKHVDAGLKAAVEGLRERYGYDPRAV